MTIDTLLNIPSSPLEKIKMILSNCIDTGTPSGGGISVKAFDQAAEQILKWHNFENRESHSVRAKDVYENLCEQHDAFLGASNVGINDTKVAEIANKIEKLLHVKTLYGDCDLTVRLLPNAIIYSINNIELFRA